MSNTERRQTGGRVGGSNFPSSQPTETSAEEKEAKPESTESPNVFGNTIKSTKTAAYYNG